MPVQALGLPGSLVCLQQTGDPAAVVLDGEDGGAFWRMLARAAAREDLLKALQADLKRRIHCRAGIEPQVLGTLELALQPKETRLRTWQP